MTVLEHTTSTTSCDRESRITKSLLGYGVIAGPVFVVVSLAQALTRPGFDPARHAWSLLSNGDLGWIQVTNFVAAGVFRADPALGFPAGTPADAHTVSWHGTLHLVSGSVGFLCLIAACLIVGRAAAARGARGWAIYSRITGVVFLAGFAGIASGSHGALTTLPFTAAVILAWSWISVLSVRVYRAVAHDTVEAA